MLLLGGRRSSFDTSLRHGSMRTPIPQAFATVTMHYEEINGRSIMRPPNLLTVPPRTGTAEGSSPRAHQEARAELGSSFTHLLLGSSEIATTSTQTAISGGCAPLYRAFGSV